MTWQLKVGDKLDWFIALQNEGNEIAVLKERPDIKESSLPFWRAYCLLASSRRVGMGTGMIPLSEIVTYCDLILLDHPDDRLFLVEIITELDSFYISKMSDKKDKKNGNSNT